MSRPATAKERLLSYDQKDLINKFKQHLKSGRSAVSFFNADLGFSISTFSTYQHEVKEFRAFYRKAVKKYCDRKQSDRKII